MDPLSTPFFDPKSLPPEYRGKVPIYPQSGPQEDFLHSWADIVIYGGGAGGGKTYALLLEAARHAAEEKDFDSVIFRRLTPQLTAPGGPWAAAGKIYPALGGKPYLSPQLEYRWPGKGKVRFAHMQYTTTVYNWQGSEVPLICFDELTHFDAEQFWYMTTRNRSMGEVRPYVRATCNPDADSWVAELIAWWIDQETGFPIPERAGKRRYFVRVNDQLIWARDPADLKQYMPDPSTLPPGVEMPPPQSLTFIPAKVTDNPALLRANPAYLVNLHSQNTVERERLLNGNWKIRPAAGMYFQRAKCAFIDVAPAGLQHVVRYWDLAGTLKTDANDPDWTVGVKMAKDADGFLYILDVVRARVDPFEVEKLLKNTATMDGKFVRIGFGLDPGQAGKAQAASLIRTAFQGYMAQAKPESGDKITRFSPFSAQALAGNVRILKGAWNDVFCRMLEGFPELSHDDDVDACSGAYEMLLLGGSGKTFGPIIETSRRQPFGVHPGH